MGAIGSGPVTGNEREMRMAIKISTSDIDFEARFATFLGAKREASEDVDARVRSIIAAVRERGDEALKELTLRFDRADLGRIGLKVTGEELEQAAREAPSDVVAALTVARDRILDYHERQKPVAEERRRDATGAMLGHRWTAVQSVGIYVPGGLASYPSSVLMNGVPAKVAGVERVVMVVPAPDGHINPLVLAAARLAGVDEVYRIGGAQAVAALAHGTETIAPVAKIVGPGNAYVAAAKRQVFGTVGIDSIAGPSEVLVIADSHNDPEWLAADLLAQAEHDTAAQSILMTDDAGLAERVCAAVERQLATLPKAKIAGESWRTFGAVILVGSLDEAPMLADRIAAEHVEIATKDPEVLASRIRNAGAIFLGNLTPEVIGDYVAGSNHVLPTARSARFSSGLGVLDFMKRTSLLSLDRNALEKSRAHRDGAGACGRPGGASTVSRDTIGQRALSSVGAEMGAGDDTEGGGPGVGGPEGAESRERLAAITLDQGSIRRSNPNVEHEREVAIYDILDSNHFAVEGRDDGPYALKLGLSEDRLVMAVTPAGSDQAITYMLSLSPFRRIIKDYFMVCESYYQAIRTAPPSRIQAIDMGRRGLHDEGSRVLADRLKGKIDVDHDTARRLFTLICALHWKG